MIATQTTASVTDHGPRIAAVYEKAQLGCIADFKFLTDMCFAETGRAMLTEDVIEARISEQQ